MQLKTKLYRMEDIINIAGPNERYLKLFFNHFGANINIRGELVFVDSTDVNLVTLIDEIMNCLLRISTKNISLMERDIIYIINKVENGKTEQIMDLYLNRKPIINNVNGKPIYAKTETQRQYLKALMENDLVIAIGSAGTGKTFLSVVEAVKLLKDGAVKKIILTRPAVEAGESLGFLPGDLREKIDPYLKPLYDALHELLGLETTENYIAKGIIEIAPLAYMRGRTLDGACIILDEAQNTTKMQMKMFLTRLGFNAKMIVTGDISQTDLPKGAKSGLKHVTTLLSDIPGIEIIEFKSEDIIRHPLVQKIIRRYEADED